MSNLADNTAGISTTVISGVYLISAPLAGHSPMVGLLPTGPYAYKARMGVAYETGVGTWNSGTNTLTSTQVKTSSNAGAAVAWGAGDKEIHITADSELLADMEKMVEGATKKILTGAERTKLGHITVTQAVNLDQLEYAVATLGNITVTQPVNLDQMESTLAAHVADTGIHGGGGGGGTYSNFTPSTAGLVPPPIADDGRVLTTGGWADIPGGESYSVFDNTNAGLVPAVTADGSLKVLRANGAWLALTGTEIAALLDAALGTGWRT